MRNADKLARGIAIAEGYIDRSGAVLDQAPARRNNPGSLRASSFASGNVNGYSIFATRQDGWKGLYRQIGLDRNRGLTVEQFIYKFAPPGENRTEAYYLPLILAETGLRRTDRLSDVIESYPANTPTLPEVLPDGLPAAAPGSVVNPPVSLAPAGSSIPDFVTRHSAELAAGSALAGVLYFFLLRR